MEEEPPIRIQNEHSCISFAFQSLKKHQQWKWLSMCCLGIYSACQSLDSFFVGDTERHNEWLSQYPGNREGVIRPYCDCMCQFHNLSNPNPNCTCISMEDINFAKNGNKKMKMLELNITTQLPCMTLEMHLLKRVFHYLTIFIDCEKWCPQSYYIHQVVGSSFTCLNHLGIRWEVEKIETSSINNIFKYQTW